MLTTITVIISTLVIVNFVLLKVSVNKIEKTKNTDKTIVVLNPELANTSKSETNLAPTGS
ncbi:hypothetical protein [Seonamhaeicola marinus]|uniref:Uncharacterized protein n=1 Tax=Seonamhaeicola marinus TaxID=1912246 RepID=A0A5D0I4M7_9FLAO|nr:hypothetical protein [Seonamhaeicola marinus]TYA78693.1 hypothetical protein FUA24_10090 [Seonamhaeicola marinus]